MEQQAVAAPSRLRRGIFASYGNWAVGLLSPLLLVPLMVRCLGHQAYGEWIVILSVASYLGLANFGIGQTVGNRVAEAAATGQQSQIGTIVSTAFFIHLLAVASLLGLGALTWVLFSARFPVKEYSSVLTALSLTLLFGALGVPLRVYSMVLRGLQRVDLDQGIAIASNLLRLFAIGGVLLAGFKLIAVATIQGLALLVPALAAFIAAAVLCPEARPRLALFSPIRMREMLRPSLGFLTLQTASSFLYGVDSLVIAHFLGAKAVTLYSIPFQLVVTVWRLFAVAAAALMPRITADYARHAMQDLEHYYVLLVRLAIFYASGAAVFLWLFGESLVRLWAGPSVFPGYATFDLQLVFLLIQVLVTPGDAILISVTRHKGYAALAVVESGLNLLLSVWWVQLWGLPGVIGGTVVARLVTNGWYIPLEALRSLGLDAGTLSRASAKPLLALMVWFGAVAALSSTLRAGSGPAAFALAAALVLSFLAIFTIAFLRGPERQFILSRLLPAVKAAKPV